MSDSPHHFKFEILDLPPRGDLAPAQVPYPRSPSLMPASAAASEQVSLTIDGKAVSAAKGTLLIEAAKQVGIEIPSYCYYPGLSLQGACRMCLVAIEKMPKLQTACTTVIAPGMVVQTANEEVKNARKAMLEFLLTNHPLDCPVCDKGGECELQDAVFRYGAAETRFLETKHHEEEQKFSNLVYYDRPRCILCYRCIRVCDEGMDVNAYGIGFRGGHSEIIPNHGDKLECEECGMCIDICPVGALTSGTYRYKTRPWELTYTGTICNHCGDGCKTTLSIRNNEIIRANNRDHSGINGEFLCAKGRFGWDFVNSDKRLTSPRIRRNGTRSDCTWEEALSNIGARLKAVLTRFGPESVAVIGSNRTTNEENFLLSRFARSVLGTNNLDHHRTADYSSLVGALTEANATDRHASIQDVADASSLLVIGNNPTQQHPLLAYQIRQAVRLHHARLYIVNSSEIKLRRQASLSVQVKPGGEAEAVHALIGNQTPGPDLVIAGSASLDALREKLKAESDTVIIFGDEIRGAAVGELVKWGLTLPGRTRFIALGDYTNSRGAADMGVLPGNLPGYSAITDQAARQRFDQLWAAKIPPRPGRSFQECLAGIETRETKALLVFGSNPIKSLKFDGSLFAKLDFLLVVDMFATETAEFADVFLPATSFAEKSGTITNTCGQVQAVKRTMRKPGTRSDLEIILALARQFGHSWPYNSPDDVLKEIIANVPGYSIPLTALLLGGAVTTKPEGNPPALERPDLIFSSRDSLFTSGTVSRYSDALNSVDEAQRPHDHIF